MLRAIERKKSGAESLNTKPASLPQLLFAQAKRYGDRVALREKKYGIWNEVSWIGYEEAVRNVAAGLIDLGAQPGDRVAMLSENRLEWLFTELGIQTARATTVGIYPSDTKNQCAFIAGHSEARIWIVEDQEQFDKAYESLDQLPHLERIVVIDMKGLHDIDDPRVMSFDAMAERGKTLRAHHPELLEQRIAKHHPDDIALFAYTSGTTGNPKGAMISHRSLMGTIEPNRQGVEILEGEELFCYLPLCHIAERFSSLITGLSCGCTVNCIEDPDTILENLHEVSPTIFLGFPRLWERLMASVEIEIDDSAWINRTLYAAALKIAFAHSRLELSGERIPLHLGIARKAADWLVFWKLREKLGLRRIRNAMCGGAPIAPRVLEFFHAIGVPIREGFGMTEISCVGTIMPSDRLKFGTVGKPLPGIDIRIAESGEILVHSPGNFQGYFKQPDKTAEALQDGWVHTGDIGSIDDEGFLSITGRIKDLIILSSGHNIAPQNLENQLKSSPYIMDAVVIGERRSFATALIIMDEEPVAHFARKQGITYSTYADLSQQPEVVALIDREVKKVNRQFADRDHIARFRIFEWQLDNEEGELTPTGKVRRSYLSERFAPIIEEMYASIQS